MFDPKYYTPSEGGERPPGSAEGGEEGFGGGERPTEVERRERKSLDLRGNSPRVILSQVEARSSIVEGKG